ncbi:hypothetical protein EUGRSUZ_G01921 [Eucalyptus grandis]|uniref:Uncharacterized protein n=2 Tax=Eucalyptus grandis TaxID=71139 RepID=A0A059BDT2_EUCGR|nr:hypothetical protein EUGRSUZ_G01921 [Eucalyptus grandis]
MHPSMYEASLFYLVNGLTLMLTFLNMTMSTSQSSLIIAFLTTNVTPPQALSSIPVKSYIHKKNKTRPVN